ncbi:hypothetical protein KFL_000690235 [Klebsormidium nitens]|uniref:Uncharacterized protein n=1 Tax=Klebsormidium nitens TaxID=105231 RepID=A0A1Y1HQY3_KLENI|nr:hypothetical protein KFL_000690235 [Klebsormidium nitens]|eukprot:GAQ81045.1 hypothetical protein KFL_000690235 [Klebsormidium nitens]
MSEGFMQPTFSNTDSPFPRFLPHTFSKLTLREMAQRLTEEGPVELDLHKPESSAWLKNILKQARNKDFETRCFALSRFRAVLNSMVINKGHALCAGFAAYVLEEGILEEVIRNLRAAQSEGDFYVFPKIEFRDLMINQRSFTLSKVEICFRLLHVLILDTRTARFVLKAIPNLLSILEGAYFSLSLRFSHEGLELPDNTAELELLREGVKASSLSVLVSLVNCTEKCRDKISSRKVFLQHILRDSVADTEFSGRIIECAIPFFNDLSSSCDLSQFLDETIRLTLKGLTVLDSATLLKMTVSLIGKAMKEHINEVIEKLYELRANGRVKHEVPALLGVASCPDLDETTRALVYMLLANLNEQFEMIFDQTRPFSLTPAQEEKLEKLVAAYPQAVARREQLSRVLRAAEIQSAGEHGMKSTPGTPATIFQAASKSLLEYVRDKAYFPGVPATDPKARKKPCRKCSRSSCSRVESAPCEFKVCSGCRLAVYCSKEGGCGMGTDARHCFTSLVFSDWIG